VVAGLLALAAVLGACGADADDRGAETVEEAVPALAPAPAQLAELASLERPTQVAARPGADDLYATLQADGVAVLEPHDDGTYEQAPELLVDRTEEDFDVQSYVEAGVLGLTFSDDGDRLYLVEAMPTGDLQNPRQVEWRLLEYTLDGNTVVEGSERVLLSIIKERPVHNSGQVRFGPDGYLYVGLGDGWPVGDELESGQDRFSQLGKVMRIDPTPSPDGTPYSIPPDNPFADGVDGAPEVWLYGVRNPWRFHWDPATGDLWLTDVGDATIEEINRLPAGTDRGANLGWSEVEGSRAFDGGTAPADAVPPVYEYEHAVGFCAVIGGALLPESTFPEYAGWFAFSDFCALEIFAIDADAEPVERVGLVGTDVSVTSIETMPDDRVLVTTLEGLYRLEPTEEPS
jgi:glucose/arabinose dehydrogenase